MKIIERDGDDYLVSNILKLDSTHIDCNELFDDIHETINQILEKTNQKEIKYGTYGSSISSMDKRFSATYFSPSFMKGYMTNPATSLYGNFAKEEVNDATAIGTTVHKILELYYKMDRKDRDRQKLDELLTKVLPKGQDEKTVQKYIDGYKDSKDYLDKDKELDDTKLDCFCEYRGRANVYIPKFDVSLPIPVSYVVDRIDVRGDKLYIIDYKTGHQTAKSASFDGYLTSMILYKWVVEQDFSMPVKGGYLLAPGNTDKYLKLDFSLVNESKVVDQVLSFYEQFKQDTASRIYTFTNQGYFTSEDLKHFREFMQDSTVNKKLPVEIYLGAHKDVAN